MFISVTKINTLEFTTTFLTIVILIDGVDETNFDGWKKLEGNEISLGRDGVPRCCDSEIPGCGSPYYVQKAVINTFLNIVILVDDVDESKFNGLTNLKNANISLVRDDNPLPDIMLDTPLPGCGPI